MDSNEERERLEAPSAVDASFAVSVLLAEMAFLETRALRGIVGLLVSLIATGAAIGMQTTVTWGIWAFTLIIVVSIGVSDVVRASTRFKEMVNFRELLKRRVEERIRRLEQSVLRERRPSEPYSSEPSASSTALEHERALLKMAESSRFSQLRLW